MDELLEYTAPRRNDPVEAWRLEQLLQAGYPVAIAADLAADPSVDLHRAIELVAGGCAPELAGRILL